jgi:hypothetical protein
VEIYKVVLDKKYNRFQQTIHLDIIFVTCLIRKIQREKEGKTKLPIPVIIGTIFSLAIHPVR